MCMDLFFDISKVYFAFLTMGGSYGSSILIIYIYMCVYTGQPWQACGQFGVAEDTSVRGLPPWVKAVANALVLEN